MNFRSIPANSPAENQPVFLVVGAWRHKLKQDDYPRSRLRGGCRRNLWARWPGAQFRSECFPRRADEIEIFVADAAALIEPLDLGFQRGPIIGGGRRGVVPQRLIGTLELPFDFLLKKTNAHGAFDAVFQLLDPLDIALHGPQRSGTGP